MVILNIFTGYERCYIMKGIGLWLVSTIKQF